MTTVAGRKKSIVSSGGVILDMAPPVANNNVLNKAASASLYQRCAALRAALLRVRDFPPYFAIGAQPESSRKSTDPVTQLWDCFATGIPLCYLFNLLPHIEKRIECDTDIAKFDNAERTKKHAVAKFIIATQKMSPVGLTVTDFVDRNSTDGFVKVIEVAEMIVERLPSSVYVESPPSPPPSMSTYESTESLASSDGTPVMPPASTPQEAARNNILMEMLVTERKYVQDLEVMQKYAEALAQSSTLDKDTIHLLFPNLNKLLNFQRRFLIRFEGTADMPWKEQHWGQHFLECEEEFAVYEPYCANYNNASDLMVLMESVLSSQNHLINARSELPAFLIKPVQRICKYPLLLDSLIKAAGDYPLLDELKEGLAAAKRITDKINEAQRRAENVQTVKNLEGRVADWKGHNLSNFGELLLEDIFMVNKSDVDREYHVFLFEKIILCCKELAPPTPNLKKVGKSNSILKKQLAPPPLQLPGGVGATKKKDTPLLLKGRIFINNVTQAVPNTKNGYSLAVWWSGEDDVEFFTLRCRTEEQLKQWEAAINRLIGDVAKRRATTERQSFARGSANATPNSTNPSPYPRNPFDRSTSGYGSFNGARVASSYQDEYTISPANGAGPQGYPQNAFEMEHDDEFEDYPPATSGRGTPVANRRGARTPGPFDEDGSSFRTSNYGARGYPAHPPVNGLPAAPALQRPIMSRLSSTASGASGASYSSEVSFGTMPARPPTLRSQFSSNRLRSAYDRSDPRSSATPVPMTPGLPNGPARSRSASQPSAYIPKQQPPPLPTAAGPWAAREGTSIERKRGSGSSQSTGDSSDYSPHSSSPITPYGSSDSSLGGSVRGSNSSDKPGSLATAAVPVKVKVHFHEDIFVIQVPRSTEYNELVEKVGKKIRLCGPRRDDGPLRVKYRDEDGDMVSLGSTEDVQMAFEAFRPGGQVTLYVQ